MCICFLASVQLFCPGNYQVLMKFYYYFRTLLTQEAVITVKGLPMSDYLESLVKGTCSTNAQKV